jgi:hypothetical protein
MKNSATRAPKQTLDTTSDVVAGAVDNSIFRGTGDEQHLAELVWKYFGEEITQALTETQEALTPEMSGSRQQVGHRKR